MVRMNLIFVAFVTLTVVLSCHGEPLRLAVKNWHKFQLPKDTRTSVVIESVLLEEESDVLEGKAAEDEWESDKMSLYCGEECEEPEASRNYTVKDAEKNLAFETVYPNGTRTLTRLRVQEEMVEYINGWRKGARIQGKGDERARRRRAVFEFDTRFEVNIAKYLTSYPFSAAVTLSTGCTGVLISPQHVMTAAHCLHNGNKYIVRIKDLKAGFRRERKTIPPGEDPREAYERAFIWIRADKAYLPYDWINNKKSNLLPLDKDYAVIMLKRSPEREHLEVGMGDTGNVPVGTMVHFSSFDIADQPKLFYRFCTVTGGTQELFYQQCDGEPPSIGAGVYVRQWNPEGGGWSRKVIGLFGGLTSFVNSLGLKEEHNFAMRITPLKFAQICFWVTGEYGDCKG